MTLVVTWHPVSEPVPPELHSSAMEFKQLLLAIPRSKYARMGWFLGGLIQEFREDGSPSEAKPTHWMPMPVLPGEHEKGISITIPD